MTDEGVVVEASYQSVRQSSTQRPHRRRQGTPVAEFAANALRSALFEGELKPGDQVNQYVWADRLGISRAALREGLKVLASTKVLDHDPNRGYRVAEMGLSEMAELYWLRIAVEREVAFACRIPTETETAQLVIAREALETAFTLRDPRSATAAERSFTFQIFDLSARTLLGREAKRLWDLAELFRFTVLDAAAAEPEESGRVRRRRDLQLQAVLDGDRFGLAELMVSDRRAMIDRFHAMSYFPRS